MAPVRQLVFVGTEGIYHDHEGQGRFLAELLDTDPRIQARFSITPSWPRASRSTMPPSSSPTSATTESQESGLLRFIEEGGGFFGLHTADASFRDNDGYHQMLNGFFDGHSPYMDFTVTVSDPADPSPRAWKTSP